MGVLGGGLLNSAPSGGEGGGVTSPLGANLDVAGFSIISSTGDVLLDSSATAGGDIIAEPNASGFFIVRQTGGVVGTDEIQFEHDGTNGFIQNKTGTLKIQSSNSIEVNKTFKPAGDVATELGIIGKQFAGIHTFHVYAGGDFNHTGTKVGFYGTTAITKQTGVAVTAGGIHASLVALGLITA